jgi:hypothetical protein
MGKAEAAFREHMGATLLGRLKLKLADRDIAGPEALPTPAQMRRFLLRQYRQNATLGRLYFEFLNINRTTITAYGDLPKVPEVGSTLLALESTPLETSCFVQIVDCPSPLPSTIGALVYCEELRDGGYVYTITLLEEASFPDHFVGRAEVRASAAAPEPAFGILRNSDYENISRRKYQSDPTAVFLLQLLAFVNEHRFHALIPLLDAAHLQLKADNAFSPPRDPTCSSLVRAVIRQQLPCTLAEVDLARVKPHDLEFALRFPLDVVDSVARLVETHDVSVLVYWQQDAFIMSDCYPAYLALRKLQRSPITAVIMGPFPTGAAKAIKTGGPELLPPILVSDVADLRDAPPELQDFFLQRRLTERPLSKPIAGLYAFLMAFAELLHHPATRERELHEFLREHTLALSAYGGAIVSELRLGAQYRVDLAIRSAVGDERVLLVELERSDIRLFTRKGRFRVETKHAVQQVEDWLRWWNDHPREQVGPFSTKLAIDGAVVMGRSIDMTSDEKERLISLNRNRRVQVITYDDLLDRIEALIAAFEREDDRIEQGNE